MTFGPARIAGPSRPGGTGALGSRAAAALPARIPGT